MGFFGGRDPDQKPSLALLLQPVCLLSRGEIGGEGGVILVQRCDKCAKGLGSCGSMHT